MVGEWDPPACLIYTNYSTGCRKDGVYTNYSYLALTPAAARTSSTKSRLSVSKAALYSINVIRRLQPACQQDADIHLQGEIVNRVKTFTYLDRRWRGWRTGRGSHPQSAERVEEREESVSGLLCDLK